MFQVKCKKKQKGVHFMCSSIKIKDMVKQDCEELFLQAAADGVINGCSWKVAVRRNPMKRACAG